MAQHDYNLANQSGADFRADLNNALSAIVTVNSGATAPSTTFAHQLWVDTSSSVLKIRNSANDAWVTTGVSITADNTFTGNLTGNVTGNVTGDITGNADTATALETARTINGTSFDGTANISFDTDSVSEGSANLYYTSARFDSAFSGKSTSDLTEGTNLYFTNARVESYLDAGTSTPTFASAIINTSITGSAVLDDDTFGTASATTVATSESIKAYVDSQVGSVDTLAEILANGNTTGGTDIAFGDNDKAVFGTGSDLQIYHDGTNSHIREQGTGDLLISASDKVIIRDTTDGAQIAVFDTDGAVSLNYGNSTKFATTSTGIDVTGRTTTDGLTTSASLISTSNSNSLGGTTFTSSISTVGLSSSAAITSTSNSNSLGGTSFTSNIDVTGTVTSDGLTVDGESDLNATVTITHANPRIKLIENNSVNANTQISNDVGNFTISTMNDAESSFTSRLNIQHSTGDISFYDDTGTTQALFWDSSAESLGIGTTSPASAASLHLKGAGGTELHMESGDGQSTSIIKHNQSANSLEFTPNSNAGKKLEINDTGIDVTGNITSTASTGSGTFNLVDTQNVLNAGNKIAFFAADRSNTDEEMAFIQPRLQSNSGGAGNVQEGYLDLGTTGKKRITINPNGDISFYDDTGSTQGLFWDASAENLFVGGTSTTNAQGWGRQISSINSGTNGAALTLKDSNGEYQLASYANNFYLSQGANTRFFINSSGSVGIGTSSPSTALHVSAGDGSAELTVARTGTYASSWSLKPYNADFFIRESGSDRVTIKAGGSVGIGTTSPSAFIHTEGTSNGTETYAKFSTGSLAGDQILTVKSSSARNHMALQVNAGGGAVDDLALNPDGGNVGIGTDSPSQALHVESSSSGTSKIVGALINPNSGVVGTGAQLWLSGSNATTRGTYIEGQVRGTGNKHDLIFATSGDASTPAERMRLDSSGELLAGKTSADNTTAGHRLSPSGFVSHVRSGNEVMILNRLSNDGSILTFRKDGSTVGSIGTVGADVTIGTGDTGLRFRDEFDAIQPHNITTNGTVDGVISLGKTGATFKDLHLSGTANVGGLDSSGVSYIRGASVGRLNLDDSGVADGSQPFKYLASDGGSLIFGTANRSGTSTTNSSEVARIDSSANFLIGKTSANIGTVGHQLLSDSGGDYAAHTSDGTRALLLNRLTSDGEIIDFRKDGSTVGNIKSRSGDLIIHTGITGLRFNDGNDAIHPVIASGAVSDNATDLGLTNARFKDIYAANGTIQTSDINEKQDIEDISEAETRVAVAAKGLLKKYRWKSAVADKGDNARIHFGIMAQDLQQAFSAEGLDAGDYGMFISSTWTDETTGEEKTRLGVRYNELLAFIIAAI